MDIMQLKYFLAVARYGSFSRTAAEFYTTQPTVSRQISQMEAELGYELFDRRKNPLQLTTAGKVFNDSVPHLLADFESLQLRGRLAAEGKHGTLSVTFPLGLSIEKYYDDILLCMKDAIPGLAVVYRKEDNHLVRDSLLSGKTDVAITLRTSLIESDDFDIDDLAPLHPCILFGAMHPLASKDSLGPRDIKNETLYLARPAYGYSIRDGKFGGYAIDPRKVVEVDSIATALINVRYGNGCTVANNFMSAPADTTRYKAFPFLDATLTPGLCIVSRKDAPNAAIPLFRQLLLHARR